MKVSGNKDTETSYSLLMDDGKLENSKNVAGTPQYVYNNAPCLTLVHFFVTGSYVKFEFSSVLSSS
jgi:hypothetical protein